MRDKFLDECQTEQEAFERAPWARAVVKFEDGYHAFASLDEARQWDGVE